MLASIYIDFGGLLWSYVPLGPTPDPKHLQNEEVNFKIFQTFYNSKDE